MTGQFGKNHLGDLDEHLPTAHGFHEFMGSLYHLNAEDEPEHEDYFKDPALRKRFGTRGVIHTWANPDGTQKIESTGPLNKKRMETDRRRDHQGDDPLHGRREEGRQAVLPLVELDPHAHLDAAQGIGARQDGPRHLPRRHGRARRARRRAARRAQGARPRREHHRDVLDRQRRREIHVARRRHVALPRREEHQLGRRLPRADGHSLARRHQARHRAQRHLRARGHAADAAGRRRRARRQGAAQEGHEGRQQDLQGPSRRLQHHRCARRQGAQPAPRILLLQRRRPARRPALRPVEDRLRRAERARRRGLARAVHDAARAEDLQPAIRPVRDRRPRRHGLEPLVGRAHLPARARAAIRRAVHRHVQGFSAEPETRQLFARQRVEGAGNARRRRSESDDSTS